MAEVKKEGKGGLKEMRKDEIGGECKLRTPLTEKKVVSVSHER